MALRSTQPLTEMSTRDISLGAGLTTLPSSCDVCLEIWEPHPPRTLRACPGLYRDCCYLYLYLYRYIQCRISALLNRRPFNVEALVRSRVSPCKVCGRHCGTGTEFSPVLWFSSVSTIPPVLHTLDSNNYHIINTRQQSLETFKEIFFRDFEEHWIEICYHVFFSSVLNSFSPNLIVNLINIYHFYD